MLYLASATKVLYMINCDRTRANVASGCGGIGKEIALMLVLIFAGLRWHYS